MFEMKLATCAALMGVLPESTDSLKTSYLSRENTYRLVIVDFEVGEVRYALSIHSWQAHMIEASERGVALWSHAFEDHRELCDAVQRRHGNADEADDGPLALRARKVETIVGGWWAR